ncbi:MAG TPA: hypothetical protein PK252_03265 [Bacteroidales bacterium]|nr:hypothetical protein [Bacteroidales bacterium]
MNSFEMEESNDKQLLLAQKFSSFVNSHKSFYFTEDEYEDIIEYFKLHNNKELYYKSIIAANNQYPYNQEFKYFQIEYFLENKQYSEAQEYLQKSLGCLFDEKNKIYYQAAIFYCTGHQDNAEALIKSTGIEGIDDFGEFYTELGELFMDIKRYDLAIKAFSSAYLENHEYERLCDIFDASFEDIETFKEANSFDFLTEKLPFDANVWLKKYEYCLSIFDYEKALEALDFSLALSPDEYLELKKVALLVYLERYSEAIKLFEQLNHDIRDEDETLYCDEFYVVSFAYFKLKQFEKAEYYAMEDLRLNKLESNATAILLSDIYVKTGKRAKAKNILFDLLKKEEENIDILFRLSEIYEIEGNMNKAIEMMLKLLKNDSSDVNNFLRLANLYFQINLLSKAIRTLEESSNIEPTNANIHYSLAAYYLLQNKKDLSVKHLNYALNLSPSKFHTLLDIFPEALQIEEIRTCFHKNNLRI